MVEQPRLLVVDDEEAICEGCRRIFSRQGYEVVKSSNPQEGLARATSDEYSAILLDIKMPEMSGLEFLSRLRTAQRQTPVILMTGFPSIPTAVTAIGLGAAGYVTKPFTPEEITRAVHRYVPLNKDSRPAEGDVAVAQVDEREAGEDAATLQFWHEAWLHRTGEAVYRVGAVLPIARSMGGIELRLPSIGEVVYQGLPLAQVRTKDGTVRTIPAPITGVVEVVNEQLARQPELLLSDPCGAGWIAEVCATREDDDLKNCLVRRVLVLAGDETAAERQRGRVTAMGCEVVAFSGSLDDRNWDELSRLLAGHRYGVIVLDAASLGDEGPKFASRIHLTAPAAKTIVIASADCPWEASFRSQKIFYYAVEAVEDHELVDILDSAFRTPIVLRSKNARTAVHDEPIATISITNRRGSTVTLVAAPEVLRRGSGLGAEIRGLLYERLYPIQTVPGKASVSPRDVLNAAQKCKQVVVLLAKDAGRLPGVLIRDTGTEFVTITSDSSNVTTLMIQPTEDGQRIDRLDARTLSQLARHIVDVMATA